MTLAASRALASMMAATVMTSTATEEGVDDTAALFHPNSPPSRLYELMPFGPEPFIRFLVAGDTAEVCAPGLKENLQSVCFYHEYGDNGYSIQSRLGRLRQACRGSASN